jgi:hypothetical protein
MSRGSHCWSPDTLRSCVPHALGFLSNCFPKIPRLLQRTQRSLMKTVFFYRQPQQFMHSLPPLPMADTIPVHHLLGKARCRGPAPGPLGSGLDVSGCLAAARIPPVAPPAGGPGTALARSSTIYLSILSRGSCRVPCEPHAAAHKSPPLLYICTQSPRLTPRGLHGSPRHSFPTPPSLFPILSFGNAPLSSHLPRCAGLCLTPLFLQPLALGLNPHAHLLGLALHCGRQASRPLH